MPDASDMELLRDYDRHDAEDAFAEVVRHQVNLVYSVALRHVGIPAQAEEITQAVFVILARKSSGLRPDTVLEGWLYETTRTASLSFMRGERRRRFREQEAYMQSQLEEAADTTWTQLAPLLDEGLSRLAKKDRDALMLRFFKEQSVREIAAALNVSDAAAQRRVLRAVEKLRRFFTRRGVVLSAAALTATISAHSVQAAPAALANSAATLAMAKGATTSTSTATLIKGALKLMAWSNAKTVIVIGAGVLFAAGTATVAVKEVQEHRTYPWQVNYANSDEGVKAMNTTPPQVTIVRSKYKTGGHDSLMDDIPPKSQWRLIGIHSTPGEIVKRAYSDEGFLLPSQIIWPAKMPEGFYDYIANLPSGSLPALRELLKKKFGLTASREMRDMDVLLLKMDRPNAQGLRPGTPPPPGALTSVTHGMVHFKNLSISELARFIKNDLQIPVIDQTGLAGNYDVDFPDLKTIPPAEKTEKVTQALLDKCGLKLVPSHEPVTVLVVAKD